MLIHFVSNKHSNMYQTNQFITHDLSYHQKPCEYECVCPPDGRVGRDCSNGNSQPSEGNNQGNSGSSGTASGDKQVDSLLVFPPDLFWDLNHVDKQGDLIKTVPSSELTTLPVTLPASIPTTTDSVRETSTMHHGTAPTAGSMAILETSAAPLETVSTSLLASEESLAIPAPKLTSAGPVTSVSPEQPASKAADGTSPQPLSTSSYMTNTLDTQTASPLSTYKTSTEPFDTASQGQDEDSVTLSGRPQEHPHLSETMEQLYPQVPSPRLNLRSDLPSASDRAARISNAVLPLGVGVLSAGPSFQPQRTPQKIAVDVTQNPGPEQSNSRILEGSPIAFSTSSTFDATTTNKPQSFEQSLPGRSRFPTFFARGSLDTMQKPSDERALHRAVQRVFHPLEAFQMRPKP